jgi:dihydrofolate reductase
MEIILIAAVSENGVIARDGKLPWDNIPADMKRFKKMTMGHPVIMGKLSYLSIEKKYRPLRGRKNIVLSRSGFTEDGVEVCKSLESGLECANKYNNKENGKVFIAGGQEVYKKGLEIADKIELTMIKKKYKGDRFFPNLDNNIWMADIIVSDGSKEYDFVRYIKVRDGK